LESYLCIHIREEDPSDLILNKFFEIKGLQMKRKRGENQQAKGFREKVRRETNKD